MSIRHLTGRVFRPAAAVVLLGGTETISGTYWRVTVDGVPYFVGRERGKRVRIPYQPRGHNTGYQWHGVVRDANARTIHYGRVGKSTGYLGILHDAGLIRWRDETAS